MARLGAVLSGRRVRKRFQSGRTNGITSDRRTGPLSGATPAQAGGGYRPGHDQLAGRDGTQRSSGDLAGRAGPAPAPLRGALRPRRGGSRLCRHGGRNRGPAEHHRLGQASHRAGRGGREGSWLAAALRVRADGRPGSAHPYPARRPESGRGLGGDPPGAGGTGRRRAGGRPYGRRDHGSGLLRRSPAPGHEGRGAPCRTQGLQASERADRRGGSLRSGQGCGRRACGLRSRRRHLRHLDPAVAPRGIRGIGNRRRFRPRRRRHGSRPGPLDHGAGGNRRRPSGSPPPAPTAAGCLRRQRGAILVRRGTTGNHLARRLGLGGGDRASDLRSAGRIR